MFGYLSNAVTGILGIALQKIFIIKLGETLLGVNSTTAAFFPYFPWQNWDWDGGEFQPVWAGGQRG